jgi:MoxR-like ATPase
MGSTIGTPICGVHSKPLLNAAASNQVQARQLEHNARGCGQFGKSFQGFNVSAFSAPFEFEIALPLPNNEVDDPAARPRTANCVSCTNFVPASMVRAETGYDAPLCLAKGALLLADRLDQYPKGCEDNEQFSTNPSRRPNLQGLRLFPENDRSFGVVDPAKQATRHRTVKPQEWLSDAPVTDDDRKRGIRAYRRIDDPNSYAEPCFLPVYDLDHFGNRGKQVPLHGDKEHSELYTDYAGVVWQIVVAWTKLNMTPILWGIPGVGKTEALRYMAYLMGAPFTRYSITGSSELDDLAGKMMYHPEKGTYFQYGRFTKVYEQPGVICLDEPNTAPEPIWQFTRPVFDNSKQLVLDQADGQEFDQHPDCYIALAANPAWDSRNVGTNEIGDADARRLLHINVGMPPEPIERDIITRWCMTLDNYDPAPILDDLMKVAKDIRVLASDSSINVTWGIANQVKVARLMRHFQPQQAFAIGVLNYLDPDSRRQVEESIKSYYS